MKVITYNIHKGMNIDNKNILMDIINFLKSENADVICLQEVLESIHLKILKSLGIQGYFLKTVELKSDNYGIAIYFRGFRYFIKSFYLTSKKEQRGFIHLNLIEKNKKINIINTHLGLSEEIRRLQIREMYNYIKSLSGEKIICGDFNQKNVSIKHYYDLANLFNYANVETFWPTKSRIDYIFISKNIVPIEYNVGFINLSDHYPIISVIKQ